MKTLHTLRYALLLIPCSLSLSGNSQNVAINATGNQADPSAMLDVSSTTAGVLIPRMNTVQRNAISSPATGLQIFNTDCSELNYWNGNCWISSGSIPAPGPMTTNSSTSLCASSTATYSIPAISGATGYVWWVPAAATISSGQGTTSITVTWGNYSGGICVRAYDACESSELSCLDINVNPIPPTPGNITGLASVSPGQSGVTYFIASVSGAGVYNWSVPSGATITAGVGTPAITVSYACNASSGNVSVTAGSNCGTSSPSSLAVTVTSYLAANAGSAVFGGITIGGSPTATGGYAPYTYSWLPNSNLSSNSIANPTALCSGSTTTYTLTVTDAGGCTATSSVTVTRNLTASAGSAVFGGVAIGGSNTATGGQTPYTYSWIPNNNLSSYTVANPTALCSGSTTTYTVNVNDANGCSATSSVVVTRNLTASAGSAVFGGTTIGGSQTATGGQTPYTYSWSPNNNLSSYTTANPTSLCSGSTTTYTIAISDANGCTATSSVVVTRNLTASAGSAVFGGAVIGGSNTATGGQTPYTYSWSPNNNLSSYTIANPTALCSGSTTTYTVTVSDANGCTASNSVVVTRNLAASAGSAVFGGVAIGSSQTAMGGQTPYTYSWGPNNNLSSYTTANPTAQCGGSTTIYTVTVSDANGCTSTSSVTVTRNLSVSAGSNATICNGSSASMGPASASGGNSSSYSYSWNPSTGLSNPAITNPTANPTSTTIYTVTVSDGNGCTATSSMTLTVNATPASTFTNSAPAEVNTSITFSPTTTSGVTYNWSFTSGSPASSTAQNPSVTWSSTGTYTISLTVTSSSTGCSSTTTTSITIANPTVVTFTSSTTWTVPTGVTSVQYLVVAGGGGGGDGNAPAGGGGGGGVVIGTLAVTPGNGMTVTVGAGGLGNPCGCSPYDFQGGNSVFGSITAIGGGRGGDVDGSWCGGNGGSGGGGCGPSGCNSAGSSTQTSPSGGTGYGNSGASWSSSGPCWGTGGGGGGAGGPGGNPAGGLGLASSISGSSVVYAAGGAGQATCTDPNNGTNGAANTGNGGEGDNDGSAGNGGSGIVIIKY